MQSEYDDALEREKEVCRGWGFKLCENASVSIEYKRAWLKALFLQEDGGISKIPDVSIEDDLI